MPEYLTKTRFRKCSDVSREYAFYEVLDGEEAVCEFSLSDLGELEILIAFGERRAANAVDLFLDVLTHPSPSMRIAALRGLASLDEQRFMLALSGLDEDVHWSVRAALADILKSMTPDVAIPRLQVAGTMAPA